RTHQLLARRAMLSDMGEEVASGLYAAEIEYLVEHEWARSAADILWRRSKLGLRLPAGTEAALDAWLAQKGLAPVQPSSMTRTPGPGQGAPHDVSSGA